jgi:uncharacterized membrane protein YesL
MTEAEAFELVMMCVDTAVTNFSIYVTIAFAYMTVSYLVGAMLSTFQTLVLSGLYVFSSGVTILTMYLVIVTYFELRAGVPGGIAAMDNVPLWNEALWAFYPASVCIGGVFVG